MQPHDYLEYESSNGRSLYVKKNLTSNLSEKDLNEIKRNFFFLKQAAVLATIGLPLVNASLDDLINHFE